mmetsp:Transcript_6962/g.17002  ORF Transcript_6962/g.17002 Transcript_6962/m.17002 type:complete len:907 (-) Transcript_6962:1042-3762(-)
MRIVRSTNIIFLLISVFACFCARPVWSSPKEDEYGNWFSRRSAESSEGSTLPPPPGTLAQSELKACDISAALHVDEKNKIIYLENHLLVDACLLDCEGKILRSNNHVGSIVKVRNGGHVRNCSVQLVKDARFKEDLLKIDAFDEATLDAMLDPEGENENPIATNAPTSWGTYVMTSEASQWATYSQKISNFISNPVAGYICDMGECILENSSCSAAEYNGDDPPAIELIMQECVYILKGTTDVRIQGEVVVEKNRPVSATGIVVNADNADNNNGESEEANVRLFVDNAVVSNQIGNGILVAGGANTVRISDSTISHNGMSGIIIYRRYGLQSFAVVGGSVENNLESGIDVIAEKSVFISDVLLKYNYQDGLRVRSVEDIVIDNVIIDENGMSGITVWNATSISLQGVVSKNNYQNGICVEAEGSVLEIANSVFFENGFDLHTDQKWKKAGIYTWLTEKITLTNTVSNGNSMDGILIYDVTDLSFTDVDTMKNGNDGIEIRESVASYGYDYTANSDYLVGVYYYPWHKNDFHNGGGYLRQDLTPPHTPALGEYDDSDPEVISQHLAWFRKSNIGLAVTSWWGPNRVEDSTTRDVLMEHTYLGNLKVALHYETTGRIKEEDVDMSVPESDIQYMCENYFDHPNYYKVDGRPVLFIYISRKLEELGTLAEALLTMRTTASKCGHNIYLVGDAIFAKAPEAKNSFKYFDAVTNYDVYGSMGGERNLGYIGSREKVTEYYKEQNQWRAMAKNQDCAFIPAVSPGFNDRGVRPEKNRIPLSRRLNKDSDEGSLFQAALEEARTIVDSVVGNLIMVNSWNEYHEDTQIEPVFDVDKSKKDTNLPNEFTYGLDYNGYGNLYLQILKDETSKWDPSMVIPPPVLGTSDEEDLSPQIGGHQGEIVTISDTIGWDIE